MKIEKGQPGYIKARKMRYLLYAVVEFAMVAAVFILGYVQTKSRLNLFTVLAIIGCLPAAKMLVEFITMAPYKSIDTAIYKEIEEKAPLLIRIYDLIITSNEKVMPVDAIVIADHVVCGYTSSAKTDENRLARDIKQALKNQHYEKITVKIFHDYKAFLARAEGMNNIASVEQPQHRKKERAIRDIIKSLSM